MTWWDDDNDPEFSDSEDELEDLDDDLDLEELSDEEWEDIASDSASEIDDHIKESSDGQLVHHFDFVSDALEYVSPVPIGVLTVVLDDEGGADVYREDYEGT